MYTSNANTFINFCALLKGKSPFGGPKKLPSGKLTWQWKMAPLKMYSLFENGIFHCHVSLPEGIFPSPRYPFLVCSHMVSWDPIRVFPSRWHLGRSVIGRVGGDLAPSEVFFFLREYKIAIYTTLRMEFSFFGGG